MRCVLSILVLLAVAVIAEAQQPTQIPRIGFLSATSLSTISSRIEAFRQGLRELGYVEGQNVFVEYRYAGGKADESPPKLAAELVSLKVDLIVAGGGSGLARAVKGTTKTIDPHRYNRR